jgi:hypothetical protein
MQYSIFQKLNIEAFILPESFIQLFLSDTAKAKLNAMASRVLKPTA